MCCHFYDDSFQEQFDSVFETIQKPVESIMILELTISELIQRVVVDEICMFWSSAM